jgi:hypothetical protein
MPAQIVFPRVITTPHRAGTQPHEHLNGEDAIRDSQCRLVPLMSGLVRVWIAGTQLGTVID